jgi:hypothetical protein
MMIAAAVNALDIPERSMSHHRQKRRSPSSHPTRGKNMRALLAVLSFGSTETGTGILVRN